MRHHTLATSGLHLDKRHFISVAPGQELCQGFAPATDNRPMSSSTHTNTHTRRHTAATSKRHRQSAISGQGPSGRLQSTNWTGIHTSARRVMAERPAVGQHLKGAHKSMCARIRLLAIADIPMNKQPSCGFTHYSSVLLKHIDCPVLNEQIGRGTE